MNTFTDWQLSIGLDDILRGEGLDPSIVRSGKPSLLKAATRALEQGQSLVHPVAQLREILVLKHLHERILLEDGGSLTGPLVTRQFGGAQRVVAAVCTIGPGLEEAVTSSLGDDPLFALALDGLGNAAVELLAQKACAYISEQVTNEGLQASTPLSPGSPEWPVEIGQPQIFGLIDPSHAGITLTLGGMMIPKKSMSFIVGIGMEMSQVGMCEVCTLKETCRYGHA